MTRRIGYLFGIVLAALLQARLLPELDLERTINLPATLLFVTASADRRSLALTAATAAGLTLDITLMRPLGLSSLALVVGVLAASQVRGGGDALLIRRILALLAGLFGSTVTTLVVTGGSRGRLDESAIAVVANLLVGGGLAWVGLRRRNRYQLDRSLRG